MSNNCPICLRDGVPEEYNGGYHKYDCYNCGRFMLDQIAHLALCGSAVSLWRRDRKYMWKCASIMLERNLKRLNDYILLRFSEEKKLYFSDTGASLEDFFPKRAYEQLERGFYNLVRAMPYSRFGVFRLADLRHDIYNLLFLDRQYENPNRITSLMIDEGWIYQKGTEPYALTIKGMRKFEDDAVASKTSNAFLAMWFGVDGNSLYREAVHRGISAAGYHLQVVDQEEYNGFIMDKVVNLINDSAFVIADLSAAPEVIEDGKVKNGVRGGVYWEAGYAAGQKKQVILTCREDEESMKRIHFDLQQHNQIRWSVVDGKIVTRDGVDLSDAIEQRIRATVGAKKDLA